MTKEKEKKITEVTPENLDLKIIEKLELQPDHSYILLFNTGTIPFEQAQNLSALMAEAGFKTLLVAVNDTKGIKVIEKKNDEPEGLGKIQFKPKSKPKKAD